MRSPPRPRAGPPWFLATSGSITPISRCAPTGLRWRCSRLGSRGVARHQPHRVARRRVRRGEDRGGHRRDQHLLDAARTGLDATLWRQRSRDAGCLINIVRSTVPRCLTPIQREAFHLGTPPPRWCYERNLWPFADHGRSYIEGGSPPYGPPTASWDEKLLAAWDWTVSWFSRPVAKLENGQRSHWRSRMQIDR